MHGLPAGGWLSADLALQSRDLEVLRYIARHGVCSPDQIGRKFWGGSDPTARYRRIEKLAQQGYLDRDRTWYHGPYALRVTRKGLRACGSPFKPVGLNWGTVRHQLAMIDLSEELLSRHPDAWWLTEREVRQDWLRDRNRGDRHARLPDGVLRFPDQRAVAVELELVPKRANDYREIGDSYLRELIGGLHEVWWFVASRQAEDAVRRHFGAAYNPNPWRVERWSPSAL
jgi:hypothetical protein